MKKIIIGSSIFFTILTSNTLLSLTNIQLSKLADITLIESELPKIISPTFILFTILLSTRFAIAIISKKYIQKPHTIIGASALTAFIASQILLPNINEFLALDFVCVIALTFTAWKPTNQKQNSEQITKTLKQAMLLLAIGFFISSCIAIYPIQEQLTQKMQKKIFSTTLQSNDIQNQVIEMQIQNQKIVYNQIKSLPSYQKIAISENQESKNFIKEFLLLEQQLESEQTKELIKRTMQQNLNNKQIQNTLQEKIPFYQTLQEYFWLMTSILFTQFFLIYLTITRIIANIISKHFLHSNQ